MARPRSAGGTSLTRWPSIISSPAVISSSRRSCAAGSTCRSPTVRRRRTNSRSSMSRSTPLMICDVAVALADVLERARSPWLDPPAYLTAPKVRPRTSWRWLIQPNTRMGAMASVEAAESLAQNRPSGAEKEAMKAVSGRGVRGREVEAPERLVPAQDDRQQRGRGDARQRQRQQQHPDLLLRLARRPCGPPRGSPSAPP